MCFYVEIPMIITFTLQVCSRSNKLIKNAYFCTNHRKGEGQNKQATAFSQALYIYLLHVY